MATLRHSKLGFRPGPHGCSTSTFPLNFCRTRRIGSARSESLVTTIAVSILVLLQSVWVTSYAFFGWRSI